MADIKDHVSGPRFADGASYPPTLIQNAVSQPMIAVRQDIPIAHDAQNVVQGLAPRVLRVDHNRDARCIGRFPRSKQGR